MYKHVFIGNPLSETIFQFITVSSVHIFDSPLTYRLQTNHVIPISSIAFLSPVSFNDDIKPSGDRERHANLVNHHNQQSNSVTVNTN